MATEGGVGPPPPRRPTVIRPEREDAGPVPTRQAPPPPVKRTSLASQGPVPVRTAPLPPTNKPAVGLQGNGTATANQEPPVHPAKRPLPPLPVSATERPLPPLPSGGVSASNSSGQASVTKKQSQKPVVPPPSRSTHRTSHSARTRPVITVVEARPMNEVGFRGEQPVKTEPAKTNPEIVAAQPVNEVDIRNDTPAVSHTGGRSETAGPTGGELHPERTSQRHVAENLYVEPPEQQPVVKRSKAPTRPPSLRHSQPFLPPNEEGQNQRVAPTPLPRHSQSLKGPPPYEEFSQEEAVSVKRQRPPKPQPPRPMSLHGRPAPPRPDTDPQYIASPNLIDFQESPDKASQSATPNARRGLPEGLKRIPPTRPSVRPKSLQIDHVRPPVPVARSHVSPVTGHRQDSVTHGDSRGLGSQEGPSLSTADYANDPSSKPVPRRKPIGIQVLPVGPGMLKHVSRKSAHSEVVEEDSEGVKHKTQPVPSPRMSRKGTEDLTPPRVPQSTASISPSSPQRLLPEHPESQMESRESQPKEVMVLPPTPKPRVPSPVPRTRTPTKQDPLPPTPDEPLHISDVENNNKILDTKRQSVLKTEPVPISLHSLDNETPKLNASKAPPFPDIESEELGLTGPVQFPSTKLAEFPPQNIEHASKNQFESRISSVTGPPVAEKPDIAKKASPPPLKPKPVLKPKPAPPTKPKPKPPAKPAREHSTPFANKPENRLLGNTSQSGNDSFYENKPLNDPFYDEEVGYDEREDKSLKSLLVERNLAKKSENATVASQMEDLTKPIDTSPPNQPNSDTRAKVVHRPTIIKPKARQKLQQPSEDSAPDANTDAKPDTPYSPPQSYTTPDQSKPVDTLADEAADKPAAPPRKPTIIRAPKPKPQTSVPVSESKPTPDDIAPISPQKPLSRNDSVTPLEEAENVVNELRTRRNSGSPKASQYKMRPTSSSSSEGASPLLLEQSFNRARHFSDTRSRWDQKDEEMVFKPHGMPVSSSLEDNVPSSFSPNATKQSSVSPKPLSKSNGGGAPPPLPRLGPVAVSTPDLRFDASPDIPPKVPGPPQRLLSESGQERASVSPFSRRGQSVSMTCLNKEASPRGPGEDDSPGRQQDMAGTLESSPEEKNEKPQRPPPLRPSILPQRVQSLSEETSPNDTSLKGKSPPPSRPSPPKSPTSASMAKVPPPRARPPSVRARGKGPQPRLPARPQLGHPLYHYVVQGPHGIALFDYTADAHDELSFKAGEVIELIEAISDTWMYGRSAKKEGMFPANFIDVVEPPTATSSRKREPSGGSEETLAVGSGPRCVARFDYEADDEGDLTFESDEVITLISHVGEDWLRGRVRDKEGIFPLAFVEIIEDLPLEGSTSSPATPSDKTQDPSVGTALYDFTGQEGELTFKEGAKVKVISQMNSDWLYGSLEDGTEGMFPAAYIDLVPSSLPKPSVSQPESTLETQYSGSEPVSIEGHVEVNPDTSPGQHPIEGTSPYEEAENAIVEAQLHLMTETGLDEPYCIAMFSFEGESPSDLSLKEGDRVTLTGQMSADWLRGRLNGHEGIFPKAYVKIIKDLEGGATGDTAIPTSPTAPPVGKAVVLHDFEAQSEDDLPLKVGEDIDLLDKIDDVWYRGSNGNMVGMFPAAFVKVTVPIPESSC